MARLLNRLTQGQFVVTVEIDPPRGPDAAKTLEKVRGFADRVDAVNVADCPMANVRMSPITLAHLIQRDAGVEAIFHLTCRDRNTIGLQAELLGAAGLGVRNILALRGDEPTRGDHPSATGVFEIGSSRLIKLASTLNAGSTIGGSGLDCGTDFTIGCVANPNAEDLEAEVDCLEAKIAAGAHFAQTQPVFDLRILEHWLMKAAGRVRIPILYGVMPLRNYEFAVHLNNDVPGITVPEWAVERMRVRGPQAGMEMVREFISSASAASEISGIHIFPMNNAARILKVVDIIDELGLRCQRKAKPIRIGTRD
ncbi:MAG TPA: 5,10-methylenetetrahydrofolate reductase [Firmicutes bacterium]|nr:5,10-methylenetetrahydrofolate reductase [Bacillota bacterium]